MDVVLIVAVWVAMAATSLVTRRVRWDRAQAGTPIPRWAALCIEILTFATFGGLLHVSMYIKERFSPEDEEDIILQHRTFNTHVTLHMYPATSCILSVSL